MLPRRPEVPAEPDSTAVVTGFDLHHFAISVVILSLRIVVS
jgi:hypothetical protein